MYFVSVTVQGVSFSLADSVWDIAMGFFYVQLQYDHFEGSTPTIAGIWNDLNEPGTFDDANEKTLPPDALHRINEDENVKHRDIHNVYGLLQVKKVVYILVLSLSVVD